MVYFHAYADVGIHAEMIKDHVRTDTYRNAIMHYKSLIEGKVYAVDASDIAVQANEVVKANKLSDTIILLHGRVEDVEIDEEVDFIVSEWMGYMLLYESMLGSVITARDRWLKPGGRILPSNATLFMAPVTHPDRYSHSVDFWRNAYGIDSNISYKYVILGVRPSITFISSVCLAYFVAPPRGISSKLSLQN